MTAARTADRPLALSRRTALAGAAASLAVPLLPLGVALATIPLAKRRVGIIDVIVISDGALTIPLSAVLPDVPVAERDALLAANGLSTDGAPVATNVSLIATGNELMLIDAGAGANFQPTAGKLVDNMEAAGLDPAKVTKIVFTHGHADHLWGAIDDFNDSEHFANASYVISAAEWDFWTDPETPTRVPDRVKGMARGSARILKRLESKIEYRKSGDTLAAGISYVETLGHTPGHMSVLVESGNERLLIGADALAHAAISFARPDWRWGSDHDGDRAIATRKRLLDRLAAERMPLIGFHLPWPGIGMVEKSGTAYRFVPSA